MDMRRDAEFRTEGKGAKSYISLVLRIVLGVLFLFSGIAKAFAIHSFASTIGSLSLGLRTISVQLALAICIIEIVAGASMILGVFVRVSSLVLMLLLVLFIAVFLPQALVQNKLDCDCFGPFISGRVDTMFFVRDFVLLTAAFLVHFQDKQILALDNMMRKERKV